LSPAPGVAELAMVALALTEATAKTAAAIALKFMLVSPRSDLRKK
jgi:hypothetical protein